MRVFYRSRRNRIKVVETVAATLKKSSTAAEKVVDTVLVYNRFFLTVIYVFYAVFLYMYMEGSLDFL